MIYQKSIKSFSEISKNVAFSALSKGVGIVSQLVITAILSRILSKEEFGLWAILGHFIIIISIFDLGIGGGALRNTLAKHNAVKNTQDLQKKIYFSSFFLIFVLYTALFFLWFFFSRKHFSALFHIKESQLLQQLEWVAFFVLAIFAKMPFSIYSSGFSAYQEHFLKGAIEVIEQLALVLMIILMFFLKGGFLVFLVSYYSLYLCMGIFGFLFFLKIRGWKWTKISYKDLKELKKLIGINSLFWIQNLVSLFLFSLSPFLISFFGNLELGGEYSLIYRFSCLFLGIHFALLNPLWSAYTDAFYKSKFHWIEIQFIKSLKLTVVFLVLSGMVMIFFYKPIIYLWTGKNLNCTPTVVTSFFWMLLYGTINCFSVLLNSINKIQKQVLFLLIGSILNACIGCFFGKSFGMMGVVVAGIIALIPLLCSNVMEVLSIRQKHRHETLPKNINN